MKRPNDESLEEREDQQDVEENDEVSGVLDDRYRAGLGFVGGLILGALIGAGTALLIAPQRGEVTRRRLKRRFRDARDDARDQLAEWTDDARREVRRRGRQIKRRLPV